MTPRRLLLTSALLTSLLLPVATRADEDHTPLGEQMEIINDAFRQLRRQAEDPAQNASSLELLATIRAAAEKSLAHDPEYAADKPADERETFVKSYRDDLRDFIATLDATAAAFKAGNNTEAAGLVAELRDAQRTGHKAYRRPKD